MVHISIHIIYVFVESLLSVHIGVSIGGDAGSLCDFAASTPADSLRLSSFTVARSAPKLVWDSGTVFVVSALNARKSPLAVYKGPNVDRWRCV